MDIQSFSLTLFSCSFLANGIVAKVIFRSTFSFLPISIFLLCLSNYLSGEWLSHLCCHCSKLFLFGWSDVEVILRNGDHEHLQNVHGKGLKDESMSLRIGFLTKECILHGGMESMASREFRVTWINSLSPLSPKYHGMSVLWQRREGAEIYSKTNTWEILG